MATNCIRSVTTADGTKIDITVDGKNFRVEGRRPTPTVPQPMPASSSIVRGCT